MSSVRGWSCGKPSACNNILEHCYGKTSIVVFFNEGLNITCFLALFNFLRKTALCAFCWLALCQLFYFCFTLMPINSACVVFVRNISGKSVKVKNSSQKILLAVCRPSVGHLLANCWPTVGWLLPVCLSWYLSLLFMLFTIISSLYVHGVSNPATALLVAFNGDRHNIPDQNHCFSHHFSTSSSIPSCWKARPGLKLVKLTLCAGYLVLLSGDVSLNSGPANKLNDVVKLHGLKFVHQNVQSLGDTIDQLCLLLQELHSGRQIITLSETWIKPDRSDSEY